MNAGRLGNLHRPKLKVLDLFAGLQGWSKPFRDRGHDVLSLDLESEFGCDITADILEWDPDTLPWRPDIILASPPCEGFTVLTIMKNWTRPTDDPPNAPKTDQARLALRLVERTREVIDKLDPTFWVIENPRAKLRALPVLSLEERVTVTYCKYSESYMKPTDLWGGFPVSWVPKARCVTDAKDPAMNVEIDGELWRVDKQDPVDSEGRPKPCHRAAPRGSRTGVQGELLYKGGVSKSRKELAAIRAEVPEELALSICEAAERDL